MREIVGDILSQNSGDERIIICHQVNCRGVMGAGLAKQIRCRYPSVGVMYKVFCDIGESERKSYAYSSPMLGKALFCDVGNKTVIANLFGQDGYRRGGVSTNYEALRQAFQKVAETYPHSVIRIPYKIGCGLAGGDWAIVQQIIEETLCDKGLHVEIWRLN